MSVSSKRRACAAASLLLVAAPAIAETVPDEYSKTIRHHNEIATLTDDFAGDHIDLSTGRLDIIQTDIDLPGNNALAVRVARRFQPGDTYRTGHFGMWEMDLPSIRGTFMRLANGQWPTVEDETGAIVYTRCTNYGPPPKINYNFAEWAPGEYWYGNMLHLPGSGDRELLTNGGHRPVDGHTYTVGTKEGDAGRCVPLAATSVSGSSGEGFEIVTTDGVVYTLNQMVTAGRSTLKKSSPMASGSFASKTRGSVSSQATTQLSTNYDLPREDVILFPTKATDRFGNTVTYIWNPANEWQLLQIVASDGRHLDFTYESSTSNRVTVVTDGPHTWRYSYNPTTTDVTFTQPDNGVWTYNLRNLFLLSEKPTGTYCGTVNGVSSRTTDTSGPATRTGTITAPSGATVTFGLSAVLLGRSFAIYNCPNGGAMEYPYLFVTAAVVSKKITGPGLPSTGLSWSYAYGPTNNCWDPFYSSAEGVICTGVPDATRTVKVTSPEGDVTKYTFGNKYNDTEGLLQKTEYDWKQISPTKTSALRTTEIFYASPTAAPYLANRGFSIRSNGDYEMTGYVHPQSKVVTTQQGRTFTWQIAADCAGAPLCLDSFARPTKVIKTSTTP